MYTPRKPILFALALSCLVVTAEAGEPTEYEQYMLELINRARANPTAEVSRLDLEEATQPGYWGVATGFNSYDGFSGPSSVNEGPPYLGGAAYTIPVAPKQPLAFNSDMIDTSQAYVLRMQAANSIGHEIGGTDVYERLTAQGYTTDLPWNSGQNNWYPGSENNAYVATSDSFDTTFYAGDIRKESIDLMHHGLFTDDYSSTRGHRMTMLASDWQEAGVGIDYGKNGSFSSAYSNCTFGVQAERGPFITGVAFNDLDGDQFFTPEAGEPIAGITVTVYKTGTTEAVAKTTSFGSGGYTVEVPGDETYDVRFTSTTVDETYSGIAVTDENVKVDAIDPGYNPPTTDTSDPAITAVELDGLDVKITWASSAGSDYQVYVSTDLVNWVALQDGRGTSNETSTAYVHYGAARGNTRLYYRVAVSS